jgi:hypothetical protein
MTQHRRDGRYPLISCQRPTLRAAAPDELADIFDVTATYDSANHQLELTATITPAPPHNDESRLARGGFRIAGAGFLTDIPDRGYRFVEVRELA